MSKGGLKRLKIQLLQRPPDQRRRVLVLSWARISSVVRAEGTPKDLDGAGVEEKWRDALKYRFTLARFPHTLLNRLSTGTSETRYCTCKRGVRRATSDGDPANDHGVVRSLPCGLWPRRPTTSTH